MKKKKESIFVRVAFGRTEHTQSRGAIAKEGSERSTLIALIANVSHSHVVQTLSQLGTVSVSGGKLPFIWVVFFGRVLIENCNKM